MNGNVDWSRITELQQEVGEEAFTEIATVFLEEVDEVIGRLKSKPDPALLAQDMHFLKGCALNLGFSDMASHCQQVETSDSQRPADCQDLTAVILSYETSKAQFRVGLASGALA